MFPYKYKAVISRKTCGALTKEKREKYLFKTISDGFFIL